MLSFFIHILDEMTFEAFEKLLYWFCLMTKMLFPFIHCLFIQVPSCRRCWCVSSGIHIIINSYQNRTFHTNHTSPTDHFQVFNTGNIVFEKAVAPTSYPIIEWASTTANKFGIVFIGWNCSSIFLSTFGKINELIFQLAVKWLLIFLWYKHFSSLLWQHQ